MQWHYFQKPIIIYFETVLNLQSRDWGYSGGLLGFNSELAKGVNEWERAVKVSYNKFSITSPYNHYKRTCD